MDFGGPWDQLLPLVEFAYNNIYQSVEPEEARLLGTDLVQDALKKVKTIQDRLRTAQSRQKNYADRRARDVVFMVGERVLLQVSPMKGVMRFGKKGKLRLRNIGPFEILERVDEVAYKLVLPPSLSAIHRVFHVSMLQKYRGDPSHVLDFSSAQLDKDLTYEEESVAILARQVRKLRSKSYPSVRVQWRGQPIKATTWESEYDMRSRYPHIFIGPGTFLCLFEDDRLF
ncbi:uncharacterized protein [Nicotiana sylvestris]|uniref:uncharacterized protein n=1 Tax=Nicotiana sylvestris TaxID=4096 RepID=UPI00388C3984